MIRLARRLMLEFIRTLLSWVAIAGPCFWPALLASTPPPLRVVSFLIVQCLTQ